MKPIQLAGLLMLLALLLPHSHSHAQPDPMLRFDSPHQGRLSPARQQAYFRFEGMEGQVIMLRLASDEFDPRLALYAPDGTLLAANDDFDGLNAQIGPLPLPADAEYRVEVSGFAGETGPFRLSLDEAPSATALPRESAVEGLMPQAGFVLFAFEGEAGERLTLQLASAAFDPYLELYAPDASLLAANDDFIAQDAQVGPLSLPLTGRYLLIARRYQQGTGAFSITLSAAAPPAALSLGIPARETLPPAAEHLYEFDLSEPQWIIATAESSAFDAFLVLRDADGTLLASNDDHEGINAGLQLLLPAGEDYQLGLSSVFGNTGPYRLELRAAPRPALLQMDAPLRYNWQPGAEQFFRFEGRAGQRISLQAEGHNGFDPRLRLYTPAGELLASNDDGDSLDALLSRVDLPSSGMYTVTVDSPGTAPGAYTISLLDATSTASASPALDDARCTALLADAYARLEQCSSNPAGTACYASAAWQELPQSLRFDRAGDVVALEDLQALASPPMTPQRWSSAFIRSNSADIVLLGALSLHNLGGEAPATDAVLQVQPLNRDLNLRAAPDPQAPVLSVLRRDAIALADLRSEAGDWLRLRSAEGQVLGWAARALLQTEGELNTLAAVPADATLSLAALLGYGPMEAFHFQSAATPRVCEAMPPDGILVKAHPEAWATLLVNGVQVEFEGALFLQAQPGMDFAIQALQGMAVVSAVGEAQALLPGSRLWIPLDADGLARATPLGPKAADAATMATVPQTLWQPSLLPAAALSEKHLEAFWHYQRAALPQVEGLRVSLVWAGKGDLDLAVREPGGETLSYQNSLSNQGGLMAQEAIPCRELQRFGLESATWEGESLRSGDYTLMVRYHPSCGDQGGQPYLLIVEQAGQRPRYWLGSLDPTTPAPEYTLSVQP